jgi:hypothetical protein
MSFDETMLPAHLTDIVSNFSDWAYRAIEAECVADAVSSPVFHYTTKQGLEGVLSSGAIRLTHLGDLAKLGDNHEFLYASNLARDALESSYDDAVAGLSRKKMIQSYAQKFFTEGTLSMLDEITPTLGPFEFYSASFCRHGDDDFLWREYAANGAGFVLTLSPVLFADPPSSTAHGVMEKIFRVGMRYNREAAISLMKTGVQEAVASIGGAELPADGIIATTFFHAMSVRLLDYVIRISSGFKKPCYSAEQEMRLLLLNETKVLAPLSTNRDSKGRRFIQYDFVPPLRSVGMLQEIAIGPRAPGDAENQVAQLLRDHGYPMGSDGKPLIPIRSARRPSQRNPP